MKMKTELKPEDEEMMRQIVELVSEQTYIPVKDILGKSRREDRVDARHLAWFFTVKHSGLPLIVVAKYFQVQHSAIVYALKNVAYRVLLHKNKKMERDMRFIARELKCPEITEELEVV
tara:strand:- start:188 stop:541 length:354 start_codon:yes stop_codon:yes gene_type:complete